MMFRVTKLIHNLRSPKSCLPEFVCEPRLQCVMTNSFQSNGDTARTWKSVLSNINAPIMNVNLTILASDVPWNLFSLVDNEITGVSYTRPGKP